MAKRDPFNGKALIEWAHRIPDTPRKPLAERPETPITDVVHHELAAKALIKAGIKTVGDYLTHVGANPDHVAAMEELPGVGKYRARTIVVAMSEYESHLELSNFDIRVPGQVLDALFKAMFLLSKVAKKDEFVATVPKIVRRGENCYLSVRWGLHNSRRAPHVVNTLRVGDNKDYHWHLVPPLTNADDGMAACYEQKEAP